ncbi:MAG: hypothetical protein WA840_15425 [Caulobacteraceae bacterium]
MADKPKNETVERLTQTETETFVERSAEVVEGAEEAVGGKASAHLHKASGLSGGDAHAHKAGHEIKKAEHEVKRSDREVEVEVETKRETWRSAAIPAGGDLGAAHAAKRTTTKRTVQSAVSHHHDEPDHDATTERETAAPGHATEQGRGEHERRPHRRLESEISAYHSRLAGRAAAAEDIPLTIWLEQAIVERAGRWNRVFGSRLDAQPEPTIPPPSPAVAPVVVSEPAVRNPIIELGAMLLLGIVLAAIVFLIAPWFGWGRAVSTASTPAIINTASFAAAPVQPNAPINLAPANALAGGQTAPPANVTVTTIVNGQPSPAAQRVWVRRFRPQPPHQPVIVTPPERPLPPPYNDCNCN